MSVLISLSTWICFKSDYNYINTDTDTYRHKHITNTWQCHVIITCALLAVTSLSSLYFFVSLLVRNCFHSHYFSSSFLSSFTSSLRLMHLTPLHSSSVPFSSSLCPFSLLVHLFICSCGVCVCCTVVCGWRVNHERERVVPAPMVCVTSVVGRHSWYSIPALSLAPSCTQQSHVLPTCPLLLPAWVLLPFLPLSHLVFLSSPTHPSPLPPCFVIACCVLVCIYSLLASAKPSLSPSGVMPSLSLSSLLLYTSGSLCLHWHETTA